MINKLHQNATWSMRSNFFFVPTDCPHREERLGWTGDIQKFAPSASFLYNTTGMLGDWLQDLSVEQLSRPNAISPFVVPNVIPEPLWPIFPQAALGDATILFSVVLTVSGTKIYSNLETGLIPPLRRGQPGNSCTDGTLAVDAYLVHVTEILPHISTIVDESANASRYEADYRALKSQFQIKYIFPTGLLVGDTHTALSLAVVFNLHDDPQQAAAAGHD
ncbi:alfa-L-rhamnosidase, putative [Talaromyces stipitatus ATCC 10500]|uniref:Alfa-L-rhamnosidase, putative n=1 Tax=Talaromyces stipitatus (strain ATCC 10500 / CBS 375.48 / QM 6759 / NRRL 1006) TaxID=441959 RepID=B8MEH8_TALSN|nr:alfa-L-rhamnosidase, putative [Talaromyces stipitatus ATCC 10500]EED16605.1 alfa-L-rhamnosidase, putative [Talaromyces stipitatus ATCC 10500]